MRQTHRTLTETLAIVNHYGAEAITPTELLRNEGDPYRAVVEKKLELTGQIERIEKRIEEECPPEGITIFPSPAPDVHLEAQYEDQQSGSEDV